MEDINRLRKLSNSKNFQRKIKEEQKIKDTEKSEISATTHRGFPISKSSDFEEAEKNIELDESDIPVHEKFVKEEHIRKLKKR